MSWTRVSASRTTSGTSSIGPVSVTAGNLIIISSVAVTTTAATLQVKDDLNNVLSLTRNSPFFAPNNTLMVGIAYYVIPTGGSRTYTVTWTGGGSSIFESALNEFHFTGSGVVFDKDGFADISAGTTPIFTPTIYSTNAGELLYTHANPGATISGAGGPWTAGGAIFGGDLEAFILSSSGVGGTAINFTDGTNPDDWTAMAASFSDQPITSGFNHGVGASAVATGTSVTITLPSAPTLGQLVCVAYCPLAAITGLSVADGNGNSYTVTPNSPSPVNGLAGQTWLAYLLSAPSNASATIIANWTTSRTCPAFADTFTVTGGVAKFDIDVTGTGSAGNTVNTPSITPAAAGELLYSGAAVQGTASLPAPKTTSTNGQWTGTDGANQSGDISEYILVSNSGATPVNYTQSGSGWSAMAMAFGIGPPPTFGQQGSGAAIQDDMVWLGGDQE